MNATLNWKSGMQFVCHNGSHATLIDATSEHGGEAQGPTPKELVLNAMMGCTAMDVVSMLQKMRQTIESFSMAIEVEKTKQHPIHFKTAKLVFTMKGQVEREKAIKAVTASLTKYCGVNYIVSKSCAISYEFQLNGETISHGPVTFIEPAEEA